MMSRFTPDAGDFSPLLDEQLAAGQRGDFTRGEEIARELLAKHPDSHRAAFNRAWYEMRNGNLLAGLECLDRGRWVQAFGSPPLPTTKPIYRDESLENKHLLFRSEGGLGDEIINVRFAKEFAERGAKVTVSAAPSLMSVFARVEGVSAVVASEAAPYVHHDYWVPAMSAARILQKTYNKLDGRAYLSAHSDFIVKWKPVIENKFREGAPRIGLKFFGNPKFEHEQLRQFPRQLMIDSLRGRGYLNLQLEDGELKIESWEDTLAIVAQLDLVITSCTSVAHASAALGRETWILTPLLPYYIWALPQETSPWYEGVRLFRQTQSGDWTEPFSKIENELNKRFAR